MATGWCYERSSATAENPGEDGVIRVAVVGCGYWGPNLIRNFSSCPLTKLVAICDQDPARLGRFTQQFPTVLGLTDFRELLARSDVDAIALATPIETHAPLGLQALAAGKHLLVEKPLAHSTQAAAEMVAAAQQHQRVLMVDHTFVYSSPVRKMRELIVSGDLGDIYFVDSVRINLGLFQHHVNVVWDLAPHDLSIMDYLLGRLPLSVSAFGGCHADPNNRIEDVAYLNLDFGDGLLAAFHVNWLSPVKLRHFIVGGSQKSIVYNDLEPAEKIKVYDRGLTVADDPESRRGVLVDYRTGDVWSPHIEASEPLASVVRHFAECIASGDTPLTDGEAGLRVVRILEAAQRSIKSQGARIPL
jgi:predicted dehydrogenase